MKIIPLANETLSHIIFDNLSFVTALNKAFNMYQVPNNNRSDLTSLLGSELRHHLIIKRYVNSYFLNIDERVLVPIYLAVANKVYTHKFQENEMEKYAVNFAKESGLDIKENLDELLKNATDNISIFPKDVEPKSLDYSSLRFNMPSWLVKLWNNHYGHTVAFKQMKASHSSASYFVATPGNASVNPDNYQATNVASVYKYLGKGSPKKDKEFIEKNFYVVKPPLKEVVDSLEIEPIKGIAAFVGHQNSLINILVDRFGKDLSFDYISSDDRERINTKRELAEQKLNNINVFSCQASSIVTCVSSNVNTFFVMPKSTCLDNIKSSPDYFLKIDNSLLDEIILDERVALEEASNLVEVDGQLIYVVPTLNKKETLSIKDNFLSSHSDFELVKEKQYFAFDEYETTMYYAVFKRKKVND